MSDLISRQEVLDALDLLDEDWRNVMAYKVEKIPSAEQKKGKWNCSDDMYETGICSHCKWDTGEAWANCKKWFRFCPNCGADMRGEEDEL